MNEYSFRQEEERSLQDIELGGALIHNSSTKLPQTPRERLLISNIKLIKCKHHSCHLHGAYLKNIFIEDLVGVRGSPTFLWGCVYSGITLKGDLSGIMFRWQIDPHNSKTSKKYLKKNLAEYRGIDLALDISKAKFSTFEILAGIPSHLIKRNPEWHFVVKKNAAKKMASDIEKYDTWALVYEELLDTELEDVVVVLGQKGKKYKEDKIFADELKSLGLIS